MRQRDLQDRAFDAWVSAMLRHRLLVVVLVALVTAGWGLVIARLPIMTSLQDLLPDDAPDMAAYRAARARFGGDEIVLIAIQSDQHFTAEGLARLDRTTRALEAHPLVERAISLTNADWMRTTPADPSGDGALLISPFYEPDRAPEAVRAAVMADDLVRGVLVSADGRLAIIVTRLVPSTEGIFEGAGEVAAYVHERIDSLPGGAGSLATPKGRRRAIEVVKYRVSKELAALAARAGYPPAAIYQSGFPAVFGTLLDESEQVLRIYFPICLGIIGLALLCILRRPVDVLLPAVSVLPAVVWAVGAGGLIFGRLTIITAASPIMVLVVGMSDVVHLITQFRHEMARGLERREAIRVAFRDVGAACTLTSLTTLIGFGSMIFLPLPHSRELGTFAALGVVAAFVLAFVLTPVLLSFAARAQSPARPQASRAERDLLTRFLGWLAGWIRSRPKAIVAAGVALTLATLALASTITVENSLLHKLPLDHPLRVASAVVREATGGNGQIELLVDTGEAEGIKRPEVVLGLWRLQRAIEAEPGVGGAASIADVFVRIHRLMAPARAAEHPVPDNRPLLAQYLLLFEISGGHDLDALLDETQRYTRMAIRLPDLTAEQCIAYVARFDALARDLLPAGVSAHTNGLGVLLARAGPVILANSLKGLATATVLIAILMGLLFRSLKVAVLSIVPNVFPVAFGVLFASWVSRQIDADAMVYLTVCIGIAVDDTIHFLARFRIERGRGKSREDAVTDTLLESGHGILRTTLILSGGFAVTALSDYHGLQLMGFMLPATLAAAVLLDVTMVPAMAQLGLLEPGPRTKR